MGKNNKSFNNKKKIVTVSEMEQEQAQAEGSSDGFIEDPQVLSFFNYIKDDGNQNQKPKERAKKE